MNTYTVEIDGISTKLHADSLAALTDLVRGKGNRIKVWSSTGIMLIDTFFGDTYHLVKSS